MLSGISLEELYIKLMKKMCERENCSIYARLGTLMERYKETRDQTLIEEFKKGLKKDLIIKGLWEEDYITSQDYDIELTHSVEYLPNGKIVKYTDKATKSGYSRLNHFHDCIKEYQGTNKLKMKEEDIEQIEDYFKDHSPESITRREIEKVCKMLGRKSAKGNENALLRWLNPKVLDDISHLENDLLDDFNVFSKEYDLLARNDLTRKKFLYSQFVLFHMLRRRGHDCHPENFTMIRTDDRKKAHNEICRLIFKRLGWEFEEI